MSKAVKTPILRFVILALVLMGMIASTVAQETDKREPLFDNRDLLFDSSRTNKSPSKHLSDTMKSMRERVDERNRIAKEKRAAKAQLARDQQERFAKLAPENKAGFVENAMDAPDSLYVNGPKVICSQFIQTPIILEIIDKSKAKSSDVYRKFSQAACEASDQAAKLDDEYSYHGFNITPFVISDEIAGNPLNLAHHGNDKKFLVTVGIIKKILSNEKHGIESLKWSIAHEFAHAKYWHYEKQLMIKFGAIAATTGVFIKAPIPVKAAVATGVVAAIVLMPAIKDGANSVGKLERVVNCASGLGSLQHERNSDLYGVMVIANNKKFTLENAVKIGIDTVSINQEETAYCVDRAHPGTKSRVDNMRSLLAPPIEILSPL